MIHYVKGDATRPITEGHNIIVHCVNDKGRWGKGFVLALSARWPEPEANYRRLHKEVGWNLGDLQIVDVEDEIAVCNLCGQHDTRYIDGKPPVRYDAVRQGLETLCVYIKNERPDATVHLPRMGAGLAGGDWSVIEQIINDTLCSRGIDVYVYDLPKH